MAILQLSKNTLYNRPNPERMPAIAQVGWIGSNGDIYALDDQDSAREQQKGGYQPLLIQIGEWIKGEDGKYTLED